MLGSRTYGSAILGGDAVYGGGSSTQLLQVLIGGSDLTGFVAEQSFSATCSIGQRGNAQFRLNDPDNDIVLEIGQEVIITHGGMRIFAGTIGNYSEFFPSFDTGIDFKYIDVDVDDFNQLADRKLVVDEFATPNQTAGDIIRSIVTDYLSSESVSSSFVQDGLVIQRVVFQYQRPSDCFNEIARLIGYEWYIDFYRRLHFFERATNLAPYSITDSERSYISLRCSRSRDRYRNRQVTRAGKDIGAVRTEKFRGDGDTTTFHVQSPIADTPLVYVDTGSGDVQKTVGIRGVDDEDDIDGKDWFYRKSETGISQNSEATTLTSSHILRVDFKPLNPILDVGISSQEIQGRQAVEGGSGIYEAVHEDKRIDDADLATDITASLLRKYGRIPCLLEVTTDRFGLMPGQVIGIALSAERIEGEYLIESITLRDIGRGNIRLSWRAIDGESLEGWPWFFRRLAEAGRDFSLRDQDTIEKIQALFDDQTIADASVVAEVDDLQSWLLDGNTIGVVAISPVGGSWIDEDSMVRYYAGPWVGQVTRI